MIFKLFKTEYNKLCNDNDRIFKSIKKSITVPEESTIHNICINLPISDVNINIQITDCRPDVLFKYKYKGNTTHVKMNRKIIKKINYISNYGVQKILDEKIKYIIRTQMVEQYI